MRRTLILFFLVLAMPLHTAMAAERWEALPPTPATVPGLQTGHAELNGIRLFYAEIGQGFAGVGAPWRLGQLRLSRQPSAGARRTSPRCRGGQPRTWAQHA